MSRKAENTYASLQWSYALRTKLILGAAVALGLLLLADALELGPDSPSVLNGPEMSPWLVVAFSAFLVAAAGLMYAAGVFSSEATENPRDWEARGTWQLRVILGLLAVPLYVFGQWATLEGIHIARFELAGSQTAAAGLSEVGDAAIHDALLGDIGFIVAYALALFLLTRWAGCYYRLEPLRRSRQALSYAVLAAGFLDGLENACLWFADREDPAPASTGTATMEQAAIQTHDFLWQLAATFAWAKFVILLAAILFVLGGAWTWLFTPNWVREASWVLQRPEKASSDKFDTVMDKRFVDSSYGIALSGGGIRASSIALGALQVLENVDDKGPNLGWGRASVVTAISGGSNMASGWSLARSTYQTDKFGHPSRPPLADLPRQPWSLPAEDHPPFFPRMTTDMSPEERHLFANLGYLLASSPRATTDSSDAPMDHRQAASDNTAAGISQRYRPTALATALTGITINIAVFIATLWVIATPIGWMLAGLNGSPMQDPDAFKNFSSDHVIFPGVALIGAGLTLVMIWVLLGQIRALSRDLDSGLRRQRVFTAFKVSGFGLIGLGLLLTVVLTGLPWLTGWLGGGGLSTFLKAAAGAGGVFAAVGRILKKPGAKFAPYLGGVAFAVFAFFVASGWIKRASGAELTWAVSPEDGQTSGLPWLAIIVGLILLSVLISPEQWSLAGFYRGKLRIAYGTYRTGTDTNMVKVYENDTNTTDEHLREPWLHSFTEEGDFENVTTPLTICAAATVSSRSIKTHYAIPALSVTFDPRNVTVHVPTGDVGKWAVHKAPTEVINAMGRDGRKRLTTMLAIAIASAAVSPAMGRVRIGPTSMLLAFANARLGVWMPNPRYAKAYEKTDEFDPTVMTHLSTTEREGKKIGYPHTGLSYLFKEFLGIHDTSDPYLYMTDGGHWENTGIVELLRRQDIREIVCVDADCGDLEATSSLGKALDLAPLECGVRIQINLDPLRAREDSVGGLYADRTVTVGFFRQGSTWGESVGVLWYSKPGLSADMSTALLGFRESNPDFPVISTADQFFDSSTYMAYRELGRHNGRRIRKARATLVRFLNDVGLPAPASKDHRASRPDPNVIKEAGERLKVCYEGHPDAGHWVVQELRKATDFMPRNQRLDFVVALHAVLSAQRTVAET